MCNVPGRKNIYFFKVNLNMYYKMSCVHDEHRLGYGYDDAGDELLAKDVVRRQQWWLLPVPDVLRILRRLAGVYVRMDQQADIMACWLVYIYMAFILTARAFSSSLFLWTLPRTHRPCWQWRSSRRLSSMLCTFSLTFVFTLIDVLSMLFYKSWA